ncbi:MAG: orotidine-5'-phosphate decarboxylase [Cytophagales bacterium]|nr:MAG: orotidine-5'-phosphate decarboxylase [Cytophagales bacterium]TAH30081.1 MAG: orotidine-5'-phosphate decarboxylase [Cytophagales bacterium]
MNYSALKNFILKQKSYLCVGLDTDEIKIPTHLQKNTNGIIDFNKAIIEATKDFCVAYKINTAFYEAYGVKGWEIIEKTLDFIPSTHFKIADAKRGDIGNTSDKYAQTFFHTFNFDAVTVAPYMGKDSIQPFLNYENKWVILLALTSNEGNKDFQHLALENGQKLFEKVLETSQNWADENKMMYVIGATNPEELKIIRQKYPSHFFLVPGVGAQGGDLNEVSQAALNQNIGLLINASRSILYASPQIDFAEKAKEEAQKMQKEMEKWINIIQKNKCK